MGTMTTRANWLILVLLCAACGGESSEDGSGGAAGGMGGSTGSGGSVSSGGSGGGSGGSMPCPCPAGFVCQNGVCVSPGSGGSVSGGGSGGSVSGGGSGGTAVGGTGGSGGGLPVDCDPGPVLCKSMPPTCAPGQVPSVQNGCWGPCVPILDCKTVADCSGCTKGFCAAYSGWTTEYRCVMPSLQCSALACSCLAPYFCAKPYDACVDGSASKPAVTCECPAC